MRWSEQYGEEARFYLVFHGGSGSELHDIHEALDYGVVKMNIDTDTQYAFTRPIADHMFKNYDGVLKVDGEVGDKKAYDPRTYLAPGRDRHGGAGQAGGERSQGDRDNDVQGLSGERYGKGRRISRYNGSASVRVPSPMRGVRFTGEGDEHVLFHSDLGRDQALPRCRAANRRDLRLAGPREKIFFDPSHLACGIVTCGGLCPGLNDVIRAIVLSLHHHYGVRTIYGFRYGYEGLAPNATAHQPLDADPRGR